MIYSSIQGGEDAAKCDDDGDATLLIVPRSESGQHFILFDFFLMICKHKFVISGGFRCLGSQAQYLGGCIWDMG